MSVTVTAFVKATFTGGTGTGPVSVPGLQVGDRVIGHYYPGGPSGAEAFIGPGSIWECSVSVADQLQQLSSTDFSMFTIEARLLRG